MFKIAVCLHNLSPCFLDSEYSNTILPPSCRFPFLPLLPVVILSSKISHGKFQRLHSRNIVYWWNYPLKNLLEREINREWQSSSMHLFAPDMPASTQFGLGPKPAGRNSVWVPCGRQRPNYLRCCPILQFSSIRWKVDSAAGVENWTPPILQCGIGAS